MKECPVCRTRRNVECIETVNCFTIWSCPECGLEFSDPMTAVFEYGRAYEHAGDERPVEQIYRNWLLESEARYVRARHLECLAPEQRAALRWLRRNLATGTPVLDLGCGIGEFLIALRAQGYTPLGLDVAREPIDPLRRMGFCAGVGSIDEFPREWPSPQAITLFHVLEHVPDPVGLLEKIRRRFPDALLVLAVPSPRRFSLRNGKREELDYPPHHLTRWTANSLCRGLRNAGYQDTEVKLLPPSPKELTGTGLGLLLGCWSGRVGPTGVGQGRTAGLHVQHDAWILLAKRLLYCLPALYLRFAGWTGGSMMGFARRTRQAA